MENPFRSNKLSHVVCVPPVTIGSNEGIEVTFRAQDIPLYNHSFQRVVVEAIDDALGFFSDPSRTAIYLLMEEIFKIENRDIPFKVEKFAEAFEEILGPGAKLLEIQIMRNIRQKIGCEFKYHPETNLTFATYLAAVQAFLKTVNSLEKLL